MPGTVQFDRPTLARLKRAYNKACEAKLDSFVFEGHELLVAYAKYLIEYLEDRFNPQRKD